MRLDSESAAYVAMAVVLGEPLDAVADCFAAPNRLHALQLCSQVRRIVPFGLDECFGASELLPAVLETVHRAPEAMLQRLLKPERHWSHEPDVQTPSVLYYEWLERPVADAFAATVLHRPLTADHIAALVEWLTGFRSVAAQCSVLAGSLTLEAIEHTLKRCFVEHGRRNVTVSPLIVMQALYGAAAQPG